MRSIVNGVVTAILLLFVGIAAHSAGIKEQFIHPDKVLGLNLKSEFSSKGTLDDCSSGCSMSCVSFARRIIADCGNAQPMPIPGGIDRPDFQECVSEMKAFFRERSGTSGDQDSSDAIAYCTSGAPRECPSQMNSLYYRNRSNTSSTQDRTEAAYVCQNGVSLNCMATVYPQYHSRSGTNTNQDIADSVAACQRPRP